MKTTLRAAASALVLCSAATLHAASYQWNNPAGGDFGSDLNWNGGEVPGAGDTALFSSMAPVVSGSITATANHSVSSFYVNANTFTLNFGGNIFSAASPIIGIAGATANVTLENGDYRFTSTSYFGGNSVLKVTGATAKLTSSTRFDIGYYAGTAGSPFSSLLSVENGGTYVAADNNLYIGGQVSHSHGALHLTGATTTGTLGAAARVYVGAGGAQTDNVGSFRIDSGAKVEGGDAIYIGQGVGVSGTLRVDGSGSSLKTKAINVAGSGAASGGAGTLLIENGAVVEATAVRNWKNGLIQIGAGSHFKVDNINSGSAVSGDSAATLMGSGTLIATSTASSNIFLYGHIRPGDTVSGEGIGTLSFGEAGTNANLRLYSTTTTHFGFDSATAFDKISIVGALRGDGNNLGTLVLSFNYAPEAGESFTILTASSFTSTPTFSNIIWEGFAAGGDISYAGNVITLSNIVAVPEPSALLVIAGAALLAVARRRR